MSFIKNVENKYKIATLAGPVIDLKTKRELSKKEVQKLEKDEKNPYLKLADLTGLEWDGGETRILHYQERISVFANLMTKQDYEKMEKEINKTTVKGKGYEVYAWNDSSGYEYWKKQGKAEDSNYIQVSVDVDLKQVDSIDHKQLKKDVEDLFYKLSSWDNSDKYFYKKNEK